MISVIMPTMWVGAHYHTMLNAFNDHPSVGEIIIIDNDTSKTDQSILQLSKAKHFPQQQNIYVNPAWNLGAKLAQYDQLCFYSDDGLFNVSILEKMTGAITTSSGLFGIGVDCYLIYEPYITSLVDDGNSMQLIPIDTFAENPGYGTCLFIHKENYHEIPDKLKIYWGDTYLFYKNRINGKQNYEICDIQVLTKVATTSSNPQFKQILRDDTYTFEIEIASKLRV